MLLRETSPLAQNPNPLALVDLPRPEPGPGQVLIRVTACGVCHTELDEIEGRLAPPAMPVVLGHQVVGVLEEFGPPGPALQARSSAPNEEDLRAGQRVGAAWINSSCGICEYCRSDRENLCPEFRATGRDVNGGYAQYMLIRSDYAHPLPDAFPDVEAAPLLCAGAIGFRSIKLANIADGDPLGLIGFGSSAHLVLQTARYLYPRSSLFVSSRNPREREFALSLGASWTGDIKAEPPVQLNAIIETTPVWIPVLEGLRHLKPGGRLVINAIRKETADAEYLARLDYSSQLWMEKEIKSVANVTRRDVREFLALAAQAGIKPEVKTYELEQANEALAEMRAGNIRGAKVLQIH